jgi:hypothetical protein
VCTLSFSLDYPILIAPLVFSNVYLPADIGEEDPSLGVGIPVVLVLSVVSLSIVVRSIPVSLEHSGYSKELHEDINVWRYPLYNTSAATQ